MKTRTILAGICLLLLSSACTRSPKLKIEGNISHAKGKMLYFELSGLTKTDILDSVKLDEKGDFRFKTKLPGSPEFYKLRINDQFIQLGADESADVIIEADGNHLGRDYSVTGSRACELIQILSESQSKTLISFDSLRALYNNKQLSDTTFQNKAQYSLNIHRNLAKKAILESPRSPAAYFALFQSVHDYPVFDPYDKSDNKMFSAVATSWGTYFPNTIRGKNLVTLTLQGIKAIRQDRNKKEIVINEKNKSSYFEISLPNINGKNILLSSLKGKVVLLDFSAYQTKTSPSRNLSFRELYRKYAQQGFEIYQVSFDTDENFWKTGAANLPWICVHDKNSVNSDYLSVYNIQALPTFFLLDKSGNLIARDAMITDLNKEIMKLL